MLMGASILAALLAGLSVLLFFMSLWVLLQQRDPVEERLIKYGMKTRQSGSATLAMPRARYGRSTLRNFLASFGMGPRLALTLGQADVPLTATEFLLIVIALSLSGLAVGIWRVNAILGLVLGAVLGTLPLLYLRLRQQRRLRAFTQQLPDVLTLLIGALRAGYGLNQALELVVQRVGAPASTELEKVTRAINLGLPLQRALEDAVGRIGSDDFNLIVVAINIQAETGGNLVETLEIIEDTVRDRLRMLSEIRVLTAQQRLTGYVLGLLPLVVGLIVFLVNPDYVGDLFRPGWVRLLPVTAVGLQLLGFLIIRRIVDIEV